VRDVIEKNHPQPYAAEKIEPKVALDGMRVRCHTLISHHALSTFALLNIAKGSERTSEDLQRARRRPAIGYFKSAAGDLQQTVSQETNPLADRPAPIETRRATTVNIPGRSKAPLTPVRRTPAGERPAWPASRPGTKA
jgi:hypothetical protein